MSQKIIRLELIVSNRALRRHNQPAMTASPLNLIGGTPLQSHVRPPPHLMNPNPLPAASIPPMQLVAPSDAANNVVSPPANLVVTQSRYSKRAFLNGLEAVKTIIRRSTENKEEFIPNKVKILFLFSNLTKSAPQSGAKSSLLCFFLFGIISLSF